MPRVYDAIVIGGGLVGLATAYRLVREGAQVLLADRADRGRATDAGAGILSPEAEDREPDPWADLTSRAFRYYSVLLDLLGADGAGETGFARCGLLVVAASEDEREAFESAKADRAGRPDAPAGAFSSGGFREVSPREARRMFPALGPITGALYHPHAARVDGRLLARAVRTAAERHGLSIVQAGVDRLVLTGGRAGGAVVGGEVVEASRVAITGGAWSAVFGAQLGIRIPVEPQRGQIIHLTNPSVETSGWPIVEGFRGHYMVPWPDSRVAVGATRETGSGFDPRLTAEGVHEVLSEALRVAPGLKGWEIHEMRVGLRPLSADGRPVLGAVPGVEGVYVATGHGARGLHLGPYSGTLVADLMLGRAPELDLAPFGASRFRA